MPVYYFTEQGYEKLRKEIEETERILKKDIAREIATAREHGDLRENAEYEAAKMKQSSYGAKLSSLQERFANARVIRKADLPDGIVTIGKKVTIQEVGKSNKITYSILGDGETDIDNGIISYQSPLAKALIKHEIGDEVEVNLPRGLKVFKILDIGFFDE